MSNRVVSGGPFLITTVPTLTICRRVVDHRNGRMCKRPVLAATVGGLDRHVDTATLNDVGELAALIEGRATYALVAQDYLSRRTVHDISAGAPKRPVLADHTCKEIPDHHIEQAWTLAAQALLQNALGATLPDAGGNGPCPF